VRGNRRIGGAKRRRKRRGILKALEAAQRFEAKQGKLYVCEWSGRTAGVPGGGFGN